MNKKDIKQIKAIALATVWIGFSEFIRNQVLLRSIWKDHYESMGLTFPSTAVHGAVWLVWSLCFAVFVYVLLRKFSVKETVAVTWFVGFFMMWLVIGNLSVLPAKILPIALPLSVLEVYVATIILKKQNS